MRPEFTNSSAYFDPVHVAAKHLIIAGSGTDNSKLTSDAVDLRGSHSGEIVISYVSQLAEDATLSFTVSRLGSSDNVTFGAADAVLAKKAIATGGTGGTLMSGIYSIAVDTSGWENYQKFEITADLSAAGTDTASYGVTYVKGGLETIG